MSSRQAVFQGFREGRTQTLAELYRAHVDDVVRTARAIMRTRVGPARGEMADEIADVVQEAFTRAFAPEARRRFDSERSFVPYLLRIARNVAIDHWRVRRRASHLDIDRIVDRLSAEADPAAEDGELLAMVGRYIASLDGSLRRVYDALYVEGLSQRAAAERLGLGRQVIRTMEGRLRAGLHRALGRPGVSLSRPTRRASGGGGLSCG